MAESGATLSNLSTESRTFPPSEEFAAQANATADWYARADRDRAAFWAEQAERLSWAQRWDEVLEWNAPFAKWFVGGRLNVAYNCVDRHVESGHGEQVAFYWEGEPGDTRVITYAQLQREVCKTANALVELGVKTGDRVAIQLPMIPEAVVAMLACARLGAPHSVVFGGFSPSALRSRIEDAQAKLLITSDGQFRRGKPGPMKENTDQAVADTPTIEHVLVVKRTEAEVPWTEGRDIWWHDVVDRQPDTHQFEAFDSEHPLYVLYTSGTTGKPKGILHTTGGYLTQCAYTHHVVFDHKPGQSVYWCTADIGWVTGHSYIVYGPLANRATSLMYEGTPNTPHEGRHWELIQKYGVTIYYTAPTLIRTFMKWGAEIPAKYDLSSLKVLGSVGEPINPEAWMWYREHVGHNNCPVVDTWWQTETGAIMISPLPGVTAAKPGSATRPLPGISAEVVNDSGEPVGRGHGGYLVLNEPWPAMLRGIWGDEERYRETYWARFAEQGDYFAGDGAKIDEDGAIWVLGRVDDVMNVSGHRISTTEVESALVSHPTVAEAAVVGASDVTTGQGIVAFVIMRGDAIADEATGAESIKMLRDHVAAEIGPIAKPRQIMVVEELPKTRSGKIMRRLLRDIAENREIGDVTTLADSSVMDQIATGLREGKSED
ncbi:acetate--CoA ligase [Pseudonocardia asaccharolytica]|uniref:Acetyl-coenzyme A synthetase n=1 Tax=Pseudonocardia asaccharolytica DSM 44247 = NBRC 16224 TaxID=1123024 RepID=A0A511D0B9_9PSEU|nr:acetate--CoA ligase [Pseudonocardia asaccharolytica]GEL18242.1 acetyl-coenzyme A synthetase [Pseudonocardia asaccharolytica DSM 44247 = NBRC 16224]